MAMLSYVLLLHISSSSIKTSFFQARGCYCMPDVAYKAVVIPLAVISKGISI